MSSLTKRIYLGKYSLVDSFVLVLMLVSFKFHIQLADFGMIDSFVIPNVSQSDTHDIHIYCTCTRSNY